VDISKLVASLTWCRRLTSWRGEVGLSFSRAHICWGGWTVPVAESCTLRMDTTQQPSPRRPNTAERAYMPLGPHHCAGVLLSLAIVLLEPVSLCDIRNLQ
jgi:hypothetical protein